jgi:hypothetical protein
MTCCRVNFTTANTGLFQVGLHVNCPLLLYFDVTWIFWKDFQNKSSNFTKIVPIGAAFLHADGRTDITKLIAALRNIEERA